MANTDDLWHVLFFLKQGCRIQSSTTSISGDKKDDAAGSSCMWSGVLIHAIRKARGNHRTATERRSRESLQHSPVEGFMQAWRDAKAAGS